MTYNLRYDHPGDPLTWSERLPTLAAQIQQAHPDILGVQEGLNHQVLQLAHFLPDYQWVGTGRGADTPEVAYEPEAGEFNALFYRPENLEVKRYSTFWLSETPDIGGSRPANWSLPRIVTWAELRVRHHSMTLLAACTHLPYEAGNEGRAARAFALKIAMQKLNELNEKSQPLILMGDLNADADMPAEQDEVLSQLKPFLTDAYTATTRRNGPAKTFYGFEDDGFTGMRIDYIWLSQKLQVLDYEVLTERIGKYYLSDHLPVMVDFEIFPI